MYKLISTTSQSFYCSPSGTRKLIWCTGTKEECEAAMRKLSRWSVSDKFEIVEA